MSEPSDTVNLDVLFRRLAGEMRQLEQDGLRLEGWITGAMKETDEVMPPVSAALQNLDRLLQTLCELGLLFDGLADEIEQPPVLKLDRAIHKVRLRDLSLALTGAAMPCDAPVSGEVDLF
ncbi:hypothetical protein [Roseivivax sediminis]|uniref:Uncharacterized protein n=1 Tax=Roseivivax sediminis TaxID=936889 RepID=A0A1I1XMS0_9RHOB|nr:hypothetical protein [Roseivivax sediminis]SFE08627.1 hypothetical protein SAMN04515678_10664 [Roseivivax sediminis]